MDISISKIKPADEHGQVHCAVRTTRVINGVPAGVYENFALGVDDPHGLSPVVRAMLAAGKRKVNLKDFDAQP